MNELKSLSILQDCYNNRIIMADSFESLDEPALVDFIFENGYVTQYKKLLDNITEYAFRDINKIYSWFYNGASSDFLNDHEESGVPILTLNDEEKLKIFLVNSAICYKQMKEFEAEVKSISEITFYFIKENEFTIEIERCFFSLFYLFFGKILGKYIWEFITSYDSDGYKLHINNQIIHVNSVNRFVEIMKNAGYSKCLQ